MRAPISPALLFSAATLAVFLSPAWAENWPAWRGPTGDGVSTETSLPLTWSATENIKWKADLPERGNSTPIVWGERIFVTQAEGSRRTVLCFDRRDGKTRWQAGPDWNESERTHPTNPPCSASPVTDGERVIAWFGSAGVWCWDVDGKELWHVDLGKQDHEWGYGSSPVLSGDLCFINFGPGPRSFIVALEKRTGREVWRTETPAPTVMEGSGSQQGYIGSWSTPVVMQNGPQTDLVISLPGDLRGFDPSTGKERWHCSGINPLAYANPLKADGILVAMGGYGGYSIGVKAGGVGDLTGERLWQEKKNSQRIGSGVVKDGFIYMVNAPGLVQCIDPKSGAIIWQERLQTAPKQPSTWSSLVLSGDRLYLPTQASDTVVLRAAPKFEQLAVNSLDDGLCNASLAVSNGELFLRTHKHLWCIAAKP